MVWNLFFTLFCKSFISTPCSSTWGQTITEYIRHIAVFVRIGPNWGYFSWSTVLLLLSLSYNDALKWWTIYFLYIISIIKSVSQTLCTLVYNKCIHTGKNQYFHILTKITFSQYLDFPPKYPHDFSQWKND